jgi:hypothetical protein
MRGRHDTPHRPHAYSHEEVTHITWRNQEDDSPLTCRKCFATNLSVLVPKIKLKHILVCCWLAAAASCS